MRTWLKNGLIASYAVGYFGGLTMMADSKYDLGLTESFIENRDTKRLEEISLEINRENVFSGWQIMNHNDLEKNVYHNLALKKEYDSLKTVLRTNGVEARNEQIFKEKGNVSRYGVYTAFASVIVGCIGLFADSTKRKVQFKKEKPTHGTGISVI